ncbi:MAG: O-antigen ligase family protein [Alsobacter sp.]
MLPVSVMWFRVIPPFCGVAMLLLALGGDWRAARTRLAAIDRFWAAGLLAFVAVAAASLAWTPEPGKAAQVFLVALLFPVLGLAAWASRPDIRPGDLALALAVGFPIAAVLILVEMHNRTWLHIALGGREDASRMNQAAVMMALWIWPAARLVRDRWGAGAAVALFLVTAAGVFGSHSETARLGLALAILCAGANRLGWRSLPTLIGAALAAVVLLQPILMAATRDLIPYVQGIKAGHPAERMTIWASFAHAVGMAPWSGWGFSSSGVIGFSGSLYLFPLEYWTGIRDSHPHNMLLQVWVEMGALGAVPLAWLVWRTALLVRRMDWPTLAPFGNGTLAVIPIVALVGYGAWQAWWLTLLSVLPILFQVAGRSRAAGQAD